MKVLVTGGAGFLGKQIVARLEKTVAWYRANKEEADRRE